MFDLDTLKKLFAQGDGNEHLVTPTAEEARFRLQYGDLVVGWLNLEDGCWSFGYSDEFKRQSAVKPVVDFADVDKRYESDELWPFFAMRIPSLQQPGVKKIIEQEDLDKHNHVQLLKRFGRKTVANPFYLNPA